MNTGSNNESSAIFSERVGDVSIRMMLDIRNRKKKDNDKFPLCIRFVLNGSRTYYRLGESYSEEELKAIRLSTGFGEKIINGTETRFQTKMRLNSTFMQYVETVRNLAETGQLSLSRIMTALTGKSDVSSFIDVWENYIAEKKRIGKIGTADSHLMSLKSFMSITGFKKTDGFAVDANLVRKWEEGMKKKGNSKTTIGINFKNIRAIINVCIGEGYMQQKNKIFGANVRKADKVKIPVGPSRKDHFIPIEKMTELYIRWHDMSFDFPIYNTRRKDNAPFAIKDERSRTQIYNAVAMFLAQYLCCGCNLADLALIKYEDFYYHSEGKGFRFIRQKSEDTANEGEGVEVIVPITEPLKNIISRHGAEISRDNYVFPSILGDEILNAIKKNNGIVSPELAESIKERIKQENHNIGDRMKKVAKSLGWEEKLSSTWARHSFATNLFSIEVPKDYISDALGHTIENRGDITDRYISAYTIEKRMYYNEMLLGLSKSDMEDTSADSQVMDDERQELLGMLDNFSNEELQRAILKLQNDKIKAMTKAK